MGNIGKILGFFLRRRQLQQLNQPAEECGWVLNLVYFSNNHDTLNALQVLGQVFTGNPLYGVADATSLARNEDVVQGFIYSLG